MKIANLKREAEANYSAQPARSEQFEICIFLQFSIFNVQPKTKEIVELII